MIFLLNGVAKFFRRGLKTTSVLRTPRSLVKLRKLQADFQTEDGKPVWLKGGFCDRILYSTTLLSCCLALIMILTVLFDNAKPPSWKNPTC